MKAWLAETFRPNTIFLPPLYTWPALLKRILLILATAACVGAYLLLFIGLAGAGLLWFG